jgi:hypothetical protein
MDLTPPTSPCWTKPFNLSPTTGLTVFVGATLIALICYLADRYLADRPHLLATPMQARRVTSPFPQPPRTPLADPAPSGAPSAGSALPPQPHPSAFSAPQPPQPRSVDPALPPPVPRTLTGPMPLRNQGNTCFIAAAIQTIRGTLLERVILDSTSRNAGLVAIGQILRAHSRGDQAPADALARARSIAPRFSGSGQFSSAEFLGAVVNLVDTDPRFPVLREVTGTDFIESTRMPIINLSIDRTSDVRDLQTLIKQWQLSCQRPSYFELSMSPDTLCFELRPNIVPEAGDGVLSRSDVNPTKPDVVVPMDLTSNLCARDPKNYRLKSFIHYSGSGSFGHYFAYTRTTDREGNDSYFLANDGSITPITEERFIEAARQAIIVTYQFDPIPGGHRAIALRGAATEIPLLPPPDTTGDEVVARGLQDEANREEEARLAALQADADFAARIAADPALPRPLRRK